MKLVITPSFERTLDALFARFPRAKACVYAVLEKLSGKYGTEGEIRFTYGLNLQIRRQSFNLLEDGTFRGGKEYWLYYLVHLARAEIFPFDLHKRKRGDSHPTHLRAKMNAMLQEI